jgi:hypothetical protein
MFKIDCIKEHSGVNTRAYIDKKTGEEKHMHSQNLFAHLGGPFPEQVTVTIENPNEPIPLGSYKLNPSAVKVAQFGRLEFDGFNIEKSLVPF